MTNINPNPAQNALDQECRYAALFNQALQRTAPAVTLAAPPPSPAQPSRQPPQSLSLGSFAQPMKRRLP